MHELFALVLSQKDLSKAGDLFSIDDREIEKDLSLVLHRICEISANADYIHSVNDQSVVEICVTRVTSAIRETNSIERHIAALVTLLESCLRHNLCPHMKDEDPPHAKIASDVLSCIFLNYAKKSVIEKALPVAVRFLTKGNTEVCRSLSSYLSLAAMSNARLLAAHLPLMLDSIIVYRNHKLVRVLPHVYHENPEVILSHIADLIHMLHECEVPEKSSILQLCCLAARDRPQVLEPCIPQLCHYLTSTLTSTAVLQSFIDIATYNPEAFVSHVGKLKQTASSQPNTQSLVAPILGSVGKANKVQSKDCVGFLVSQLSITDSHVQLTMLREIKNISDSFPNILPEFMADIESLCQMSSSTVKLLVQQLREITFRRGNAPNRRTVGTQTDGIVTVITIGNTKALDPTKADHVAILSSTVLGGLKDQKNASTSTQDFDYTSSFTHSSQSSHTATAGRASNTRRGLPPGCLQLQMSMVPQRSLTVQQETSPQLSMAGNSSTSTIQLTPTSSRISEKLIRPGALSLDSRMLSTSGTTALPNRAALPGVRVTQGYHIPTGAVSATQQAIPVRDAIQQFCEKHLDKIKMYIDSVTVKMPIPVTASLQVYGNHKWSCCLNFVCTAQSDHCLYSSSCFSFRTKNAKIWIHLMFLAIQEQSQRPVTAQDTAVANLRSTWDAVRVDSSCSFVKLVTSNFPSAKDQATIMQELTVMQYFDLFEFRENQWCCFLCCHPEKAIELLQADGLPVFEGPLKEKKGRLKVLKPWKSRYYTLSGATITYNKRDSQQAISNIQTVKVIRKGGRGIPTAFEVFANDVTYVFKARDAENVEQWVQCLQIAIARTQRLSRESISDINVPRWASLGRPVKISSNATQYLRHGSQIRL